MSAQLNRSPFFILFSIFSYTADIFFSIPTIHIIFGNNSRVIYADHVLKLVSHGYNLFSESILDFSNTLLVTLHELTDSFSMSFDVAFCFYLYLFISFGFVSDLGLVFLNRFYSVFLVLLLFFSKSCTQFSYFCIKLDQILHPFLLMKIAFALEIQLQLIAFFLVSSVHDTLFFSNLVFDLYDVALGLIDHSITFLGLVFSHEVRFVDYLHHFLAVSTLLKSI